MYIFTNVLNECNILGLCVTGIPRCVLTTVLLIAKTFYLHQSPATRTTDKLFGISLRYCDTVVILYTVKNVLCIICTDTGLVGKYSLARQLCISTTIRHCGPMSVRSIALVHVTTLQSMSPNDLFPEVFITSTVICMAGTFHIYCKACFFLRHFFLYLASVNPLSLPDLVS